MTFGARAGRASSKKVGSRSAQSSQSVQRRSDACWRPSRWSAADDPGPRYQNTLASRASGSRTCATTKTPRGAGKRHRASRAAWNVVRTQSPGASDATPSKKPVIVLDPALCTRCSRTARDDAFHAAARGGSGAGAAQGAQSCERAHVSLAVSHFLPHLRPRVGVCSQ